MKEMIYKLYTEINDIYFAMLDIEMEGNKDSDYFKELSEYLQEKIDEERKILRGYFMENKGEYVRILDEIHSVSSPYEMRLSSFVILNNDLDPNKSKEEMKLSTLYNVCVKNVYLIYLSFLQEYIDMLSGCYRDKLLEFKYLHALTNHDMEKMLIANNFFIGKINYVDLDSVVDIFELSEDVSQGIIRTCYLQFLATIITRLLGLSDKDYGNEDNVVISINSQCLLRACLTLMRDNDYEFMSDDINRYINDLTTLDNNYSLSVINGIINERNKYKSRVRRLSLKPLED